MRTARKLATTTLTATMAMTLATGPPLADASTPSADGAHAAKKKRKRPASGQCTVWANYKRPDLGGIDAVARRWDDIARQRGFPVDGKPRRGDIAVWEAGRSGAFSTGHVAYVTRVRKSGRIDVSEFNWGSARERFGTRRNVPSAGLEFIHRRANG